MSDALSQIAIFLAGQTILLVWILSAVVQKQKDHSTTLNEVKTLAAETAAKVASILPPA